VEVPFDVPDVPADPSARDERCREAYNIQVQGLASRLASTDISRAVIGVSGGLDSAHALIVAVRAMDRLGLPRTHVLGYSMPGFATTERTRKNALALMDALGITTGEIDIRPSCLQILKDLRHPYAEGRPVYDVTFENVQAGERTSHLFRLANQHQALGRWHQRSERTRAWMVYLWRWRSDVTLQRQRVGTQDADQVSGRLGDHQWAIRRTDNARPAIDSGHRDLPGTCSRGGARCTVGADQRNLPKLQKSVQAVRCPHGATGAHQAIVMRMPGWRNSNGEVREI
jgi:NAD synthase